MTALPFGATVHSWVLVVIVLVMIVTPVQVAARAGVSPAEKASLVDLFDSLTGKNWTTNTNWISNPDPCTWYGVDCGSSESAILALSLEGNNAVGTLPESIGALSQLQYVGLPCPRPLAIASCTSQPTHDHAHKHCHVHCRLVPDGGGDQVP